MIRGLVDDVRLTASGWRWGHRPLVPRAAEPHAVERGPREFPTGWARSRPAVAVRELVHRVGLSPLVDVEVRAGVDGLDVLDRVEGPVVFAANHASHLDTAVLLRALPPAWRRRTAVAAAADYFFDVWWRALGSALVFNTFPIERRSRRRTSTAVEVLAAGWSVIVFPEGTRSADGWMGRFRPGVAALAATAGVPVVPVAVRGSYAAMPRGRGWPAPGRPPVHVRFGPPLHPEPGERSTAFTERVRTGVAVLLDEGRTSWWDSLRHAAEGTTPPPSGPEAARWRRVWAATGAPAGPERRRPWS